MKFQTDQLLNSNLIKNLKFFLKFATSLLAYLIYTFCIVFKKI